jgi:hypothetical protein
MLGKLKGLSLVGAFIVAAAMLTAIPAGAASQKVTLSLKTPKINVGQTAHISGSVSPAAADQTVRLQRFYAKEWHSYKEQTLAGDSTYNFAVAPSGAGVYQYRTASADTVSRAVTLSVYAWQDLTTLSRQVHLGNGAGCQLSATINGTFFEHTCTFQDVYAIVRKSSVEWTGLMQKCSTFEGTAGLVDSDKDVARANLSVSADGVLLYSHTFSKGQSKNLKLDISGRDRLKVTTIAKNPSDVWPLELVGLGDPRVLCAWHP